MPRTLKYILTWSAALFLSFVLVTTPVQADGAVESDSAEFLALINELREANDLAPLGLDADLAETSAVWNLVLVNNGELSHAPDLSAGVETQWAKLGENVGVASAGQTRELFDAFVASPSHLENLLDPDFTLVGISVNYDDTGRMWTTHRFMQSSEPGDLGRELVAGPPETLSNTVEEEPVYLGEVLKELRSAGI